MNTNTLSAAAGHVHFHAAQLRSGIKTTAHTHLLAPAVLTGSE